MKLFLVTEQGIGKAKNDVLVIINPKVKSKALRWLIKEYPSVLFQGSQGVKTSVDQAQFQSKIKYNKDLKLFLQPILNQKDALKVKSYGKKMKLYAQALGLSTQSNLI